MVGILIFGFMVMLFGAFVFTRFIKLSFLKPEDAENNNSEIAGIILFIGGIIIMLVYLVPLLSPMFATRGM